jgi:hypothetical protein
MAFNHLFVSVRKMGRNIVLPVDRIKTVFKKVLEKKDIEKTLDFGSGTLFWTNWFVEEFESKVCAVDVYYEKAAMPVKNNVSYYSDLTICIRENDNFSLVWACDVLHHLSPSDFNSFFEKIVDKTGIIIIKDIDATHKFGNFMNRMHDKIINGETIYDIYPEKIKTNLEKHGFETTYYFIPKLWYPHFILVAIRKNN